MTADDRHRPLLPSGSSAPELGFANLEVSAHPGATAPIVHESPPPTAPPAERTGPPTVLVIEDDAMIRKAVRRMLEEAGYQVVDASSGRMALAQLREGRGREIHFLVTDLKMEDGSGGWLLAQLAYEFPALLPRTVIMSGDAGSASAAHIATRWRCPVLAKPFSAAGLVGALVSLPGGAAVA
jgi:CheY-like chemotaxis protein